MQSAASNHITIFQLSVGDECAQRVQALIENDMYVYPRHWATDKDRKVFVCLFYQRRTLIVFLEPVWMARNSVTDIQIYLNPGLIDLIKTAFFNGPTAFGYKFKKHYVTSHPDHKEPELTIPVVALSAMAVSNAFNHNLTITDAMMIQFFCGPVWMAQRKKGQDEHGQFQGSEGQEIWRQQFQEGLWLACQDIDQVEDEGQHIPLSHVKSLFKSRVRVHLLIINLLSNLYV